MSRPVIVSPEAEAHINAIDTWWRSNRRAAPNLFAEELAAAVALLELAPEVGRRYHHPDLSGVRRVLLRTTRHHVYYVPTERAVVILAVWGLVKGSGPDLSSV